MNKRTALETGVKSALSVTNEHQASQALATFADEGFPTYHKRETNIDQAFEIIRSQRQLVWAAIGELACRLVVTRMTSWLEAGNNLIDVLSGSYENRVTPPYPNASPTLRRLLQTQYKWFGSAFETVFQEAQQGVMPQAAILEAGSHAQQVYNWLHPVWITTSNQPLARLRNKMRREGTLLITPDSVQADIIGGLEPNIQHAAAMIIGRGVAHDAAGTKLSKPDSQNPLPLWPGPVAPGSLPPRHPMFIGF